MCLLATLALLVLPTKDMAPLGFTWFPAALSTVRGIIRVLLALEDTIRTALSGGVTGYLGSDTSPNESVPSSRRVVNRWAFKDSSTT